MAGVVLKEIIPVSFHVALLRTAWTCIITESDALVIVPQTREG